VRQIITYLEHDRAMKFKLAFSIFLFFIATNYCRAFLSPHAKKVNGELFFDDA
jgi:hypothetical protein